MLLKQLLDHHPHTRPSGLPLLPVYCPVIPKNLGQFFCNGDQLLVFIEILNRLWFCQCVIECKLISSKSEFLTFLLSCLYLFRKIQQFFNDLFICQHSVQIPVHRQLYYLTELLGLDHICPFIYKNLFCDEFSQ